MTDTPTTALTIPEMNREITLSPRWVERRDEIIEQATGFVVQDEGQFNAGSALLNTLTKHSNALEKMRKNFAAPFNAAAKQIKTLADRARDPLEAAKATLKKSLSAYAEEQRRLEAEERRKAEEAAREEAERLVAEQEQEKALFGEASEPEPPAVEMAPVVHRASNSSVRVVTRVVVDSIDEDKIPRAFMTADPRKVNQYIREHGDEIRTKLEADPDAGGTVIEGVVFKLETDTRSRG